MPRSTTTGPRHLATVLTTTAISALVLAACGQSAADGESDDTAAAATDGTGGGTITITGVPAEEASALVSKFELLMHVIEEETGHEVEFSHSTDYAAVIEALVAGQADMSIGSPFSYVRAGDQGAEVEALGGRIETEGDEPGYVSYALVPADSDIEGLADVAGRTVCYVDEGSTSGYLYPSAGMLDHDLDPQEDVNAIFTGSHDSAVLAMLDGQCDLAFAYDSMVEVLMPERGELSEDQYKVVWESPLIPASPIYMNTGTLDQETQDVLRRIFHEERLINVDNMVAAGYCEDVESCVLPEDSYEYAPVEDSTYDGIREVCEITQASACTS
ncbi:phosphate/phosphite/phosphonate ABC transporter substrate-binding protein [Ornithinimicrobium pratense]|uniref:Phosphate/phosphite/phosphonate ABC transporter substrate-binding protein n=1 Tax=Ornithinimicrobium pratense TaxID=2593973 RepID=A0A5J6V519_9MICO|nr:phosphate/phosphite/phosphonate ABC transporter substrate-binding protein [Ornithinimicrobium pratense]QFG68394.1 phosphate/phosphite/phosphonate ABC transporter substrate-binding protein [Ornithinimicrobium pratense]